MKLFAHPDCWAFKKAHPEYFAEFGCGPGGIGDFFVPDTVYGLSVKAACEIHDWYYRFSKNDTEEGRKEADEIFKNNMIRIVLAGTNSWLLRRLRLRRVKTYYSMVRFVGGPAFGGHAMLKTRFKRFDSVSMVARAYFIKLNRPVEN